MVRSDRPGVKTPNPRNARKGFFEEADLQVMLGHLPGFPRPVILFGYYTGWRIRFQVLPLRWPQVDFTSGMVRLEPGATKND